MTLTSAFLCMALNIYFESRGEPELGKKLVAQATLNRAKHDESKVCNAVLARKQFAWTSSKVNNKTLKPHHKPKEIGQWVGAQDISELALSGSMYLDPKWRDVTHFHNNQEIPSWTRAKNMKFLGRVGNHYFYVEK